MVVIKELELKQFLKLFWDKKVFIVVIMIMFACLGGVKTKYFTTPVYEATGTLICARNEESIELGTTVTSTELTMPSSLAETYAELIKSDLIVSQVIQNLGLNMSSGQLSAAVTLTPVTKVYYQVSVRSIEREKSAEIANEFIKVFSEEVKKFYEIDNIYVVDSAQVPNAAMNINMAKSIKIFAGIGFVIAAAAVMIMFIFNNTVTNSEQIKRYTKLTTLASIPRYSGRGDLITLKDSKSPYAESIKILRTNLQYMYDKGNLQTVAITSSLPGEGKSWLTANLAVAFANSGKKTLIIDADMRRGRQHKLFKVRKVPGLSEFLVAAKENTGMIAIKGRRVARKGMARGLGFINKFIKIEKIPAIANIIYKEDYVMTEVDSKVKMKSLKMEKEKAKEVEVVVEPEKKTRGRKATKKPEEKEETAKKTTRKTAQKAEQDKKETVKKEVAKKTTKKAVQKVMEEVTKTEEVVEEKNLSNIAEFINETGVDNLYVLPSGSERLESSELLSSGRLDETLEELKQEYDMILVDTPPVSVVADGFLVSRMVDTNMIVLKHGNTEINELNKIKNNIQQIGGEVIGTVINKIPDANKKYYNTYYNKKVK